MPCGAVEVEVPEEDESESGTVEEADTAPRESHKMQALPAQIGARMGLSVWIPIGQVGGCRRIDDADRQKLLSRCH